MCLVDFCVHWRYMPTFLMVLWTSNGAVVFLYALLSRSFLPSAVFFLYALSPVSVMIKKTDLKKRYAVHPDSEFLYCSSKMKRSLNKLKVHRESHSRACSSPMIFCLSDLRSVHTVARSLETAGLVWMDAGCKFLELESRVSGWLWIRVCGTDATWEIRDCFQEER